MVKLIAEPISVHIDKDSKMTAFIWRRRLYRVLNILSWWREPAEWWDDKPVRLLVRVIAANTTTGTYELCQVEAKWFLHNLID